MWSPYVRLVSPLQSRRTGSNLEITGDYSRVSPLRFPEHSTNSVFAWTSGAGRLDLSLNTFGRPGSVRVIIQRATKKLSFHAKVDPPLDRLENRLTK